MATGVTVTAFRYSERFKAEFKALAPDVQTASKEALDLLLTHPSAKTLRLHTLTGFKKPTIFKIDVFTNKSWQITFELNGGVAELKRVSTHKSIDRAPR